MTDIIKTSYSELQTWRECPQKWNYRYVRHLESTETNNGILARDLGTWMHALIARALIEKGQEKGTLKYAPEYLDTPNGRVSLSNALEHGLMPYVTRWAHNLSDDYLEAWEARYGLYPVDKVTQMYGGYIARYREADAALEPIAVELRFSRKLHEKLPGELRGVIDLVYRDPSRNVIVVQDHKCLTNIERTTADDLMDSQLQLYAWAAIPALAEMGVPAPRAVSYNRLRTVTPKTPQLTATGTLSKSVSDYDLSTYLAWARGVDGAGVEWGTPDEFYKTGAKAGQPKFGTYTAEQKVIDDLSTDEARAKWHTRTFQPVSQNIQRAHLRAAVSSFEGTRKTAKTVEKFDEAPRNLTSGCRFCDYIGLCRAEMVGGPMGEYPLDELRLQLRNRPSQNVSTGLTTQN